MTARTPKSPPMETTKPEGSYFASPPHAAGSASSVWLIEDNATFRLAIRRALENCAEVRGVRAFGRCEDALAALKAGEAPDIVLMDLGLPGMGGLEGIERFKAIVPATAVIVLTMFEDEEKISRAICGGAAGYLLKKAASVEVIAAIRDVRAGGTPITAQVARHVLEMYRRLTPAPANYHLTQREIEVLELLARGLVKKEIAAQLGVSIHTADMHLRNIYAKLNVNTGTAAVAKALNEKLVDQGPPRPGP